jgi:hypothetical protein
MISSTWTSLIHASELQRSSHMLSVVNDTAFVYGGELKPRQPRDNHVYTLGLKNLGQLVFKYHVDLNEVRLIEYLGKPFLGKIEGVIAAPSPRVGTASATLHNNIYIFSGRGGEAMAPIEENGAVWKLDSSSNNWELLAPADPSAPYPPARSYHCSTSNNKDKIFIHAGCPESGRLSDLWSFDTSTRTWLQLSSAPGPPRGGTSIAFYNGSLYRMNGFDGKSEQGGTLEIYDTESANWSTKTFVADGVSGPGPRSVSALLLVTISNKPQLVTLFGECDPSSLGHQGAGKMLDDVWAYDIDSGIWSEICAGMDGTIHKPAARGWFAADVVGQSIIVVVGGLGERNERFDDAWALQV